MQMSSNVLKLITGSGRTYINGGLNGFMILLEMGEDSTRHCIHTSF